VEVNVNQNVSRMLVNLTKIANSPEVLKKANDLSRELISYTRRTIIHTTVDKNTISVIHRVMKERECKKSAAVDHIVAEYEKRKRKGQIDEVTERVIEKLGMWERGECELFVKLERSVMFLITFQ
jgi:DNA-directed RNA polymerase beta' subunit